jgi:hypothetical protein
MRGISRSTKAGYEARDLPLNAAMVNGAAMIGKAKGMRQL